MGWYVGNKRFSGAGSAKSSSGEDRTRISEVSIDTAHRNSYPKADGSCSYFHWNLLPELETLYDPFVRTFNGLAVACAVVNAPKGLFSTESCNLHIKSLASRSASSDLLSLSGLFGEASRRLITQESLLQDLHTLLELPLLIGFLFACRARRQTPAFPVRSFASPEQSKIDCGVRDHQKHLVWSTEIKAPAFAFNRSSLPAIIREERKRRCEFGRISGSTMSRS